MIFNIQMLSCALVLFSYGLLQLLTFILVFLVFYILFITRVISISIIYSQVFFQLISFILQHSFKFINHYQVCSLFLFSFFPTFLFHMVSWHTNVVGSITMYYVYFLAVLLWWSLHPLLSMFSFCSAILLHFQGHDLMSDFIITLSRYPLYSAISHGCMFAVNEIRKWTSLCLN